ncbi:alpha-1,3-mannosyl-glycoprotein 4-beta-N-acetylglucosaminyltransferase C-like [Antedon mediterranea]|uniref:alpha-1,3-mannosyl-glycoprotein 4-beta-N-acetylglucosaminyltransferase C-like n=1 Tax=Antedon mediterranea TaxID=105859 RepID=UPI003AF44C1F
MPAGRRWNQTLLGLLVVMFLLNTWLMRTVNWMGNLPCMTNSLKIPRQDSNTGKKGNWQPDLFGIRIEHRKDGFLTIGIPTVHRDKGFYIIDTLQSIVDNTSEGDKKMLTIIVFTADSNTTYNQKVFQEINTKFASYVTSDVIRVINTPRSYYPDLSNLKRNFGDSEQRVVWRTKQVLDYSYLFQYCSDLSKYYLQLEDDVKASPKFVQSIQEYIYLNKNENWSILEFSELGFIGKLFRSTDLNRFREFVLIFYADQPIDYLLKYFQILNGQTKSLLRVPSLFQHIGSYSSLQEKQQPLKDRFYEENVRAHHSADNPPADIYSSISTFSMYAPKLAYTDDPGYFWGRVPKVGDVILVIFHEAVRLKRVLFQTGSSDHPQDVLNSAILTVGRQVLKMGTSPPLCQDEVELDVFKDGKVDVKNMDDKIKYDVACLKVVVTGSQSQWVVLREIDVWVLK